MKSVVITPAPQLVLDFEPGLTDAHLSLRDLMAARVYKRGLGNTAIDLNQSPGNLSVQLSQSPERHFSIESFELYLEKSKDYLPIYYLIEKFLSNPDTKRDAAQAELLNELGKIQELMKRAGLK